MDYSNIMENQDIRFIFNIQHSSENMSNECGKDSQTHDGEEVFVCNRTKRRRKLRGLGPVAQVRRKLESLKLYNAVSGKEKEDNSKQGDLTEVTCNLRMVLTHREDNYNDENNDNDDNEENNDYDNNDDNDYRHHDDDEEHEDDGQDEQEYYEEDDDTYNMGQDDDRYEVYSEDGYSDYDEE